MRSLFVVGLSFLVLAACTDSPTYSVSARIQEGDELLYISTTSNPVITMGNPTRRVDVVVERVN